MKTKSESSEWTTVIPLLLTAKEHKCLTHFLRDRKHLWLRTARDLGISDPERVLRALAEAGRKPCTTS